MTQPQMWTPWDGCVPICEAWFFGKISEGDGWHPCIVPAAPESLHCPTHKEELENGDVRVSPGVPDEIRRAGPAA